MSADSPEEVKKSVKVTIIETTYVKTDAANFMSVVQKLTGKKTSESEAIEEKAMSIKQQALQSLPSMVQSNKEVYVANGGFELDAPCANDAVDEMVAWMVELEPHLDELYAIMNQ